MSRLTTKSIFALLMLLSASSAGLAAGKDITIGAIYLDTQGYYAGVR